MAIRTALFGNTSTTRKIDSGALAARVTWTASKQSYYTVRLLVDGDKVGDALRAYAYFRWVDDTLDKNGMHPRDRLAFLAQQKSLLAALSRGEQIARLCPEEQMLADLMRIPADKRKGLDRYIEHLMAVMAFDAERQGLLASQTELAQYTWHLAAGVTEALHYFIGGSDAAPQDGSRYLAAMAAHIVHMLRDAHEDAAAGYYNIPRETVQANGIGPADFDAPAYRAWVRQQVELAQALFKSGRAYLARVRCFRCRLAGYAYIARFERLLRTIERDGYLLRPEYPERRGLRAGLRMLFSVIASALQAPALARNSS
jgi:phytoene/squalene synthetase